MGVGVEGPPHSPPSLSSHSKGEVFSCFSGLQHVMLLLGLALTIKCKGGFFDWSYKACFLLACPFRLTAVNNEPPAIWYLPCMHPASPST